MQKLNDFEHMTAAEEARVRYPDATVTTDERGGVLKVEVDGEWRVTLSEQYGGSWLAEVCQEIDGEKAYSLLNHFSRLFVACEACTKF